MLVALERAANVGTRSGWLVRCDCGRERVIDQHSLRRGSTRTCGCSTGRLISDASTKHGGARNGAEWPEYAVWQSMLARCSNPRHKFFARYGGRGITVCERWRSSFAAFISDVGRRPPGTTLDRIDNDGGYVPQNVRWTTHAQQSRNRSTNRFVEVGGLRLCLEDWARRLGVSRTAIANRIKNGWSAEAAVTAPRRHRKAA
jgi:hypothetical protein